MARYTGAVCKLCRREGQKLFLKGSRCYTGKCALERRSYAPGQHGQARKKISGYGLQLREKQKARRYYGILEGQFHKYFLMAEKKPGQAGENLLRICESRLDNIVYLLGWADSRAEARQLVTHGHFCVNGSKVDIPSYLCKPGDAISKQMVHVLFQHGSREIVMLIQQRLSTFLIESKSKLLSKSTLSLSSTQNNKAL